MARRLRNALELVTDIGALGYDLQHHDAAEIARAVDFARLVNPQMFDWLSRTLSATPARDDEA